MKNKIFYWIKIIFIWLSIFSIATAAQMALEIDINTQSNAPLQRLVIPEKYYTQGKINDFRYVTITDKFGTSLPFEISKQHKQVQRQERSIKVYALKKNKFLQRQTQNISLKYDDKNRLTEVSKNNGVSSENDQSDIKGYILDFGKKFPRDNSQLTFELTGVTDTSFLKFNVDQSSNLKNWRRVANNEVLAQLVNQGVVTQHNSISLNNLRSRYIRLTLLSKNPQFKILTAQQSVNKFTKQPLSWTASKAMHFDEKEQAYLLEISPNLNYRKIQMQMSPAPSIITGNLSSRRNSQTRWNRISQVNFINIDNSNTKIKEYETSIWTGHSQQLKLAINYSSPQLNKEPILIKLAYQPQNITFYANGNWPYKLYLNPAVSQNKTPQLMSTLKRQSRSSMANATLGNSRTIELEVQQANINWRKISLWAVLVLGVVLMAWMAKQLLKKVN